MTTFDYNSIPYGQKSDFVNTVVEIPMGSSTKVEWDRRKGYFVLDRVEPGIFAKPCNYGFIPQTLDDDGDELDTLIVTDEPLSTGLVLEGATVIGVLNFEDDGEMDHKVIVVPGDDRHSGNRTHYEQLGEDWAKQIEHHFSHYKDLKKPGTTKVLGFGGPDEAWAVIDECLARAQNSQ